MKKKIVTGALLTCALFANAEVRTAEQALEIAKQFVKGNVAMQDKSYATISECKEAATKARKVNAVAKAENTENPYYIFNIEEGGYVIVSGDDRFETILGYSNNGKIDGSKELPDGLVYWLGMYEKEMANASNQPQEVKPRMAAKDIAINYHKSVEPLIKTRWNQNEPFNKSVPNNSPTGCVATGTAQVMKYWAYPTNGIGSHTNAHNSSAFVNFETTTYDWNNMQEEYGSGFETPQEINSVATLMYHLGVATDMQWGQNQSATQNINAGIALVNNFGYNKYIYSEQRDCMSLGAWKSLVIEQLQSGKPLCFAGADTRDGKYLGHFFVCDGYDATTGKFHFNWGWSGWYDGYYSMSALEPGTGGIGAGSGSYDYDQHILVNVQPTETGSYRFPIDADEIYPRDDNPRYKNGLVMSTMQLANNTINFSGVIGAAVYDNDGNLVKFAPASQDLPGGFIPGTAFNGMYQMLFDLTEVPDGSYTICLAAQHKDYKEILTPVRAKYGNPYTFKITISGWNLAIEPINKKAEVSAEAAPVLVSNNSGTVYQNVESHYTITVTNNSLTDFFDEVGVRLGKIRGGSYVDFLTPCYVPAGETKTVDVYGITPSTFDINSTQNICNIVSNNGNVITVGSNASVTVKSEADDIPFVNADENGNDAIYSLNGQMIQSTDNLPKGIYIQNNKKFIVK